VSIGFIPYFAQNYSTIMQTEKAKAHLSVEILERFAPYMDDTTVLFQQLGTVLSTYTALVESMENVDEEQKTKLVPFMRAFNEHIQGFTNNFGELKKHHIYLSQTTQRLIDEYKVAAETKEK